MKTLFSRGFSYLILGIQHVFTMNIYVAPLILASLLASDAEQTARLIQMTFLASGIATLIQVSIGIRLPVMQGPSFVPLGALAAVGKQYGLQAMIGATIPGALAIFLLSYPFRLLGRLAKTWISPLVGGTITLVIGVSLIPLALHTISTLHGSASVNFSVAGLTALLLTLLAHLRLNSPRLRGFMQSSSVILALLFGTTLMAVWGTVEFSAVHQAPWFSMPQGLPWGTPEFRLEPVLLVSTIYAVILVETIGTWYVVGAVMNRPMDETLINRGGLGQGLGCLAAALVGGTPVAGYSSNAGILSITRNFSRWVAVATGVLLVTIGMIPKLIHFMASIPTQAMLGVFIAACGVIAYNGFLLVQRFGSSLRTQVVAGVPVLLSVITSIIPHAWIAELPASIAPFLSSGICVGAVSTILLGRFWPEPAIAATETVVA